MASTYATVDEYIASLPGDVRVVLEEIRRTIHAALPDAGERISYQIPTITLGGKNIIHFAAWKSHISVYPVPAGDEDFERQLAPYQAGKGTLKFPLGEPVPYSLIGEVATRLAER